MKLEKSREDKRIFLVSEIVQDIKLILESTFGYLWVEGEISNFSAASSGHYYFSLKDENALLASAMFGRSNKDVKFKIENGLKVVCYGKISAYGPRSQYQLIVEKIEPKGIGALQLALEQLKERLEKEGLFSVEHKRPVPYLPSKIGIVTSAHGAAIKDILKVLDRRFKDVNIIINPARVQGEGAKEEISQAIKDFNVYNKSSAKDERIEVMIVGRGGGSIEDLWAFNEEIVARAIYNSAIPVISAVGHERDWTISDLVADLRVPTPSAAAEQVLPKKEDLQEKITELKIDLKRSFTEIIDRLKDTTGDLIRRLALSTAHIIEIETSEIEALKNKLALLNPRAMIKQYKERVLDLAKQISVRMNHFIKLKESEFFNLTEKMSSLNPLNILKRGFSLTIRLSDGKIVKEPREVKTGEEIRTKLYSGELISKVIEVKKSSIEEVRNGRNKI
ncbi:MAG: exodeoxyribonuclease VII large subunit [Candidatus Omnitrophota bacterium]